MHRTQAGTPDSDGWYSAESTEGGFSIRLPIPFNDFTGPANDDGTKHSYVIGAKSSEGVRFAAARLPWLMPHTSPQAFLSSTIEGFEKAGTLREKQFHTIDGYVVLDYSIKQGESAAFFRTFALNDGTLILAVEFPSSIDASTVKTYADKFFDSAKILKGIPSGETTASLAYDVNAASGTDQQPKIESQH